VQRQIIAGVHEIFPASVSYIDRCGMISSFRKVGPFLSSWGLQAYRAKGEPVFRDLIGTAKPAFIVMNSPVLGMERQRGGGLLEADIEALGRGYPWYWGPIRVAGGIAQFDAMETAEITVPFPARYRIETQVPLLVEGERRINGDVIDVDREVHVELVDRPAEAGRTVMVKLFLAAAGPRPSLQPIPQPIFTGL
jgi:hypothetical protein